MMSIFSKSYWFPTEEEVRSRITFYEEIHHSNAREMELEANLQQHPPDMQVLLCEYVDVWTNNTKKVGSD